jgi:hypothetical protein
LATLQEARCHALKMIAEVLGKSPECYWEHEVYQITVTDETWMTLFTVEINSNDSPFLCAAEAGRIGEPPFAI